MRKIIALMLGLLLVLAMSCSDNAWELLPLSGIDGGSDASLPNFNPGDFIPYIASCPEGVDASYTEVSSSTSFVARQNTETPVQILAEYKMNDVGYKMFKLNGSFQVLLSGMKTNSSVTLSTYSIPEQSGFTLSADNDTISMNLKMDDATEADGTLTQTDGKYTGVADLSVPSFSSDLVITVDNEDIKISADNPLCSHSG